MPADVVVGLVVPTAIHQLELAGPVVVPARGQVVVEEVLVVHEVVGVAIGIETGTHAKIQHLHLLDVMLVGGVELPALILQIGAQQFHDTPLVVGRQHRATR